MRSLICLSVNQSLEATQRVDVLVLTVYIVVARGSDQTRETVDPVSLP